MAEKKALQLAARFSLPPNSLGYCGHDTAPERFNSCVIHGDCEGVDKEIEGFIVLHPYLKTIGELTGKPKLDHEVIEAYTLGNDLLNTVPAEGYDALLDNFVEQGVPDFFVDELRENQPKKFIPTHLFQVLHVGVGKASGSVPFNLETINNCMVRWGKVTAMDDKKLTAKLNMLSGNPEALEFSVIQEPHEFEYNLDFLPNLKVGDTIAVHWQQVIKILTPEEIEKVDYWTREVLANL